MFQIGTDKVTKPWQKLPLCFVEGVPRHPVTSALRSPREQTLGASRLLQVILVGLATLIALMCLMDARTNMAPVNLLSGERDHARQLKESSKHGKQRSDDDQDDDAHDDQFRSKKDSDVMFRNGKKMKAVGDADKALCSHADEMAFQSGLALKVLRCECTWEVEDYVGVLLLFVVALTIMVCCRAVGNRKRNSQKKLSNWFLSCSTIFAVLTTAMLGYGRDSCFTWADLLICLGVALLLFLPPCWCVAYCVKDAVNQNDDGTEDGEEEEDCLLCSDRRSVEATTDGIERKTSLAERQQRISR